MTQDTLADCRFCSLVSKANGEDPIGTAETVDHWLIVELPLPWTQTSFQENPRLQPILALMRELNQTHGVKLRPMAIAPDREYSQPGYTRVFYYRRPSKLFATYEKQEFIVPEANLTRLAIALLNQIIHQPNELSAFEGDRQKTTAIREMLVCTHGSVDIACARFGFPIYETLRKQYAAEADGKLRVWRCSHFGGHQFAPTLIDLPEGRYWGHLEPESLNVLVHRHGSPSDLRSFYRGWAGLSKFEQIVEREVWLQEGWDWLSYHKAGITLQQEETRSSLNTPPQDPQWVNVRLDFATSDSSVSSFYEARVEISGQVMTAIQSGKTIELVPVNQYRVSSISC